MRKSEVKRPLGKANIRWDVSIRLDISRNRMGGVSWIDVGSAQGQVVRICNRCNEPSCPIQCGIFFFF